jgi:hypothetical protein
MGIVGGPGIITNNLDFVLDVSNPKNYFEDDLFVEYLVAGGGGGGSGWGDGVGGGAGGVLLGSITLARGSHTIVVGAGGARGTNSSSSRGTTGSDSSLNSFIAYGGGGGGSKVDNDGLPGGCGGGGYGDNVAPNGVGGSGVIGQGYKGGDGINYYRGGSGGGAGGAGIDGSTSDAAGLSRADGGIGKLSYITGSGTYYGGGGAAGGCCDRGTGIGGLGGGGNAGNQNIDGTDGTVNTGGGGGGGGSYFNRATYGGNGGSGIVIIRYAGSQKATGGNTVYTQDGYTVHIFTSSGTFAVNNVATGSLSTSIFDLVNIVANDSAPSYSSGILQFDGSNDYILLNHNLNFSNPVTVDVAVKFDSFTSGSPRICEIYDSSVSLQVFRDSTTGKIATTNDGTGDIWSTLSTNIYYFITVVFTSSDIKLYINGAEQTSSGNISSSSGNRLNKISLGARSDLDPVTFLDGEIGYFRVYNTQLSATQIRQNYNAFRSRYS